MDTYFCNHAPIDFKGASELCCTSHSLFFGYHDYIWLLSCASGRFHLVRRISDVSLGRPIDSVTHSVYIFGSNTADEMIDFILRRRARFLKGRLCDWSWSFDDLLKALNYHGLS